MIAGTENSIKEMIPETKGPRDDNNKNESRKACTMKMLMRWSVRELNQYEERRRMNDRIVQNAVYRRIAK